MAAAATAPAVEVVAFAEIYANLKQDFSCEPRKDSQLIGWAALLSLKMVDYQDISTVHLSTTKYFMG